MAQDPAQTHTAFFYGTLMHPSVLHRVCHGSTDASNPIHATHQFTTRPAILHDYRRQRVRAADYPAILPHPSSTVRGALVTGLTDADIWRLDIFEGDEYTREKVSVRILTTVGDADGAGNVEGEEEVEAEVYVWKDGTGEFLEPREWDFAEFEREKLRFWTGRAGETAYRDVDDAVARVVTHDGTGGRGLDGSITSALLEEQSKDLR